MRKTPKSPGEKIVKDIKRATRKHYSSEEKVKTVLDGLRREDSIAEPCRREGISQGIYYKWSKDNGPVTRLCRPRCSFTPLSFRMRRGFSSPVLSDGGVDCRTRLCIRRSLFQLAAVFPMTAARSARP